MPRDDLVPLERALHHVSNFELAIDGGANIGAWAHHMAQHFKTVLAFEPVADTYAILAAAVADCHNVTTYQAALGSCDGRARVCEDEKRMGKHRARFVIESAKGTVALVSIDSLDLQSLGFLKLDIEGAEYFALRGARATLRRCAPVVMIEQDVFPVKRYHIGNEAAAGLLVSLGYRLVDHVGRDFIYKR